MRQSLLSLLDFTNQLKLNLVFKIIEVGAQKINNHNEPFYDLIENFPGSKLIGFEPDETTCEKLNLVAKEGFKYFPFALGKANEKRKFYITNHSMCSSLYEPNEDLIRLYNNFNVAYLKKEGEIETITLDHFIEKNNFGNIDFIKIDVQGAELDVFQGSTKVLKDVLKIVCEVEFIEHYKKQPLFGDICQFLKEYNFMFNKFLGLSGRAIKPLMVNGDPNIPSQHIWSDAVFIHNIQKIKDLSDEQLIKLSLLSCVYNSLDLTYHCLSVYDNRHSLTIAKDWILKITKG